MWATSATGATATAAANMSEKLAKKIRHTKIISQRQNICKQSHARTKQTLELSDHKRNDSA